jgi:hypothetical protein
MVVIDPMEPYSKKFFSFFISVLMLTSLLSAGCCSGVSCLHTETSNTTTKKHISECSINNYIERTTCCCGNEITCSSHFPLETVTLNSTHTRKEAVSTVNEDTVNGIKHLLLSAFDAEEKNKSSGGEQNIFVYPIYLFNSTFLI